jgi:sulfate transport system substrate-binding protein
VKSLQLLLASALLVAGAAQAADQKKAELLNASYDVARELFTQINPAFQAQWKAKTGQEVQVRV